MTSETETEQRKKMGRENLLTGNWGEQYISERLSFCDCFVRHVPQGHDTGIDLYCETTSDDKRPFLHFWCQVKTSRRLKGKSSRITLNRQSKEMNMDYWLRQPIPVLIFEVPDLRNEDLDRQDMIPFYIFNAIDFHNEDRIWSSFRIEKTEQLKAFLNENLLIQTFRWDLMRGRVSHLLSSEPSYTITFPKKQALDFEAKLQESLRWTLRLLADDILSDEDDSESLTKAKPYVASLEILATYIRDKHYETYKVIGDFYRRIGNVNKALENYETSFALLSKDQKISRSCTRWEPVFMFIEEKLRELESGIITPKPTLGPILNDFATPATGNSINIQKNPGPSS